jgi:hypothetical protein
MLLLAITNKLCQDVASVPFLWVLPLGVYLLTFVICFDSPRWYTRVPFTLAFIGFSAGICWALFHGNDVSLQKQIVIYAGGLFIACIICHGELYRLRPEPSRLTSFYLSIAAGGAVGGCFVAVLAPMVFNDFYELHLGLFLCGLLFLIICAIEPDAPQTRAEGQSGVPEHVPRFTLYAQRLLSGLSSWRALACALTLVGFVGLDRFLVEFGDPQGTAGTHWSIAYRSAIWLLLVTGAVFFFIQGKFRTFGHWRLLSCMWLGLGLGALGYTLWLQGTKEGTETVLRVRNFYGVLTLYDHEKDNPDFHYFLLEHGRITHGLQIVDPKRSRWPTSYYGEESGVGLAMRALPAGHRRIGLVGLGAGTLTAYGQAGDYFRIYEINPEVPNLAGTRFTYLASCPARVDIVPGDARLTLEREPPEHFDLLVLDAFSSDSIPVHLLTKEAFELYERHLNTNGVIAVHISNHFLDLEPVVVNLARHFSYRFAAIDYDQDEEEENKFWWLYPSTWILLSRDEKFINTPTIRDAAYNVSTNAARVPLWTDDFTSLFQIIKR